MHSTRAEHRRFRGRGIARQARGRQGHLHATHRDLVDDGSGREGRSLVGDGRQSELIPIGSGSTQHVYDYEGVQKLEDTPHSNLEKAATEIVPPRASKDIFAPVNDARVHEQDETVHR